MLVTLALVVTLSLGAAGAGPMNAHGPSSPPSPRTQAVTRDDSVTLVLVEALSTPGSVAEVRRNRAGAKRPVIALKRSALSAELVAAAFRADTRSRERLGTKARVTAYIGENLRLRPVFGAERARFERIIEQLRNARPAQIPGIGHGPAITVATENGG